MQFIDTHCHLYLENFDADRDAMLQRAIERGITKMLLPNIDMQSITPLLNLCNQYPENCYPMLGLHPTSVGADFEVQLQAIEATLKNQKVVAIGEIGIDLYWDKTFLEQQTKAFRLQMEWAKDMALPIVIHTREAFPMIFDLVEEAQDGRLKGVFHCFSGSCEDAKRILDLGFYMGIGGVLTYKKSTLPEAISNVPLTSLLLETDAPFLPPVPFRGKRNESAYIFEIASKLAEVKQQSIKAIAEITTQNAISLFNLSIQ
jgi:TatD DNase family protein